MRMDYVTLRIPADALEALREAVATGEGLAQAAADVAGCEEVAVTMFASKWGASYRAAAGKPLRLFKPRRNTHGEIVIPAHLSWLKGQTIAEARGSIEQALRLANALTALVDPSELKSYPFMSSHDLPDSPS